MTPTDTTMPVTPARLSATPEPGDDRVEQRRPHAQPEHHDEAEGPVVEDHVEAHEREAEEAGGQPGLQRVLAERGRHGLHRLRLEGDRQDAVAERQGQVLGLGLA